MVIPLYKNSKNSGFQEVEIRYVYFETVLIYLLHNILRQPKPIVYSVNILATFIFLKKGYIIFFYVLFFLLIYNRPLLYEWK